MLDVLKCNTHITDINNLFTKTFDIIKSITNLKYEFEIKEDLNPIPINEMSSIGEQIKHYRQVKGIYQKDIADLIDIDRYTMYKIENSEYKQIYYPDIFKKIIKYLDIEDKLIWNDKYLEFIYKEQQYKIKEYRIKRRLTQNQFCELMGGITISTVRKWEKNDSLMSRKMFNKFYDLIISDKNKTIDSPIIEYLDFLENNPIVKFKQYIKKEQINTEEFANKMNRNIAMIRNLLNGKSTITQKQFYKFKELLENQKNGIISSDPYINFIKKDSATKLKILFRKSKLSYTQISKDTKIGRCTIGRWGNNYTIISRNNYNIIMKYLDKKKKDTN